MINFNPPTPWGVGLFCRPFPGGVCYFNPPTPWGVGRKTASLRQGLCNFNPPTPWGVGRKRGLNADITLCISIHPLRGEWDRRRHHKQILCGISIHPLRGEWDCGDCKVFRQHGISIHPLRGEWDRAKQKTAFPKIYFNPPTPWGVGRTWMFMPSFYEAFQSTHSVGSGTYMDVYAKFLRGISIHPLRGEWDSIGRAAVYASCHFNPPTPWGVGRSTLSICTRTSKFQSTHSVGSGTMVLCGGAMIKLFQSTHSVGSGTRCHHNKQILYGISIHPLRGEWDSSRCNKEWQKGISIHPLRGEWDICQTA